MSIIPLPKKPYEISTIGIVINQVDSSGNSTFLRFEPGGSYSKYYTKKGFENEIAKLEDTSRGGGTNLFGMTSGNCHIPRVLRSHRPDDKTYLFIPDMIDDVVGTFEIQVHKDYKEMFDGVGVFDEPPKEALEYFEQNRG